MCAFSRLSALGAFVGLLLVTRLSHATWVETRVKAHAALVDVERDGTAVVRHELLLVVRGGPLRKFQIQGLDSDAEPLDGANAVPIVKYGVPNPIPVALSLGTDGAMTLRVARDHGMRTGSYRFVFRYRTKLLSRDRIRRKGAWAEIEWIGPRFTEGIDAATVVFRIPEGTRKPRVPEDLEGSESVSHPFLSSIKDQAGKVELSLVRPYIARGEPAVWRVLADAETFGSLIEPKAPAARIRPEARSTAEPAQPPIAWLVAGFLLAIGYGGLVLLKQVLHGRDCEGAGARARALVPLASPARAGLAGCLFASAILLGYAGDTPTLAALCLLAALATAALRVPRNSSSPRGPGNWFILKDSDAFVKRAALPQSRWLDTSTREGALSFAAAVTGVALVSSRIATHSPYHALALGLASSALLPIFCTGRAANLRLDFRNNKERMLRKIAERLRAASGLKAVAWARIADGSREPDELRVLVRVAPAKDGLLSLEVGLEEQQTWGGIALLPFVLIRAREGSEAQYSAPRSIRWQRGRRPDERVAIVRPALPSVDFSTALVEQLVAVLSGVPGKTRKRSSSGLALTSRIGVRSPAQAIS